MDKDELQRDIERMEEMQELFGYPSSENCCTNPRYENSTNPKYPLEDSPENCLLID